jgi:hypothetical protein
VLDASSARATRVVQKEKPPGECLAASLPRAFSQRPRGAKGGEERPRQLRDASRTLPQHRHGVKNLFLVMYS